MKINTLRYFLFVAFSFACGVVVSAQESESEIDAPSARELNKLYFPWLHSSNAAGMPYDTGKPVATIRSNYSHRFCAFKHPQDGRSEKVFTVFSEGFANFANLHTYGSFEYNDLTINEAGYNASILDPHRGMPYYIADIHESNWRKHNYKLLFKVATEPIHDKITIGLTGRYSALHGAKQRDPRTDNRLMELELTPSMVFALDKRHRVGLSAGYMLLKEQSYMQNVNASDSQDYYSLLGLGKGIKEIGDGETSDYKGIRLSAEAHYQASLDDFMMMLTLGYRRQTETATVTFSTPRNRGSILLNGLRSSLEFAWNKSNLLHHLQLTGQYAKTQGIEYLNVRDSSEEQKGWIQLHRDVRSEYRHWRVGGAYTMVIKYGSMYDWKFELFSEIHDVANVYLIPRSDYSVRNWKSGIDVVKCIALSDTYGAEILLRAHGTYAHNLNGDYRYNGSNPDSPMVQGLEKGRLAYESASYMILGGEVTLASKLRPRANGIFFTSVGYDHTDAKVSSSDKRGLFSVSFGYNF